MTAIDIRKLFDFAIQQEHDAFDFYKAAAARVSSEAVRQIFEELALEEQGHAHLLEHYKIDATLVDKFNELKVDYLLAETMDSPPLTLDMRPADAMALAMKKEQFAAELYKNMAAAAVHAVEKNSFESLMRMELNHKHRLENAFVNIGYPEVF